MARHTPGRGMAAGGSVVGVRLVGVGLSLARWPGRSITRPPCGTGSASRRGGASSPSGRVGGWLFHVKHERTFGWGV